MLDKAIKYASNVHKGMYRKGSKQPYIFHPIEVLSLTSLMSDDEDVLCAAVLHDTIEDTNITYEDLKKDFNKRVAELVKQESEDKSGNINKDATWKQRKLETIEHLRSIDDKDAKIICLADKVSNLRSFHLLQLQVEEKMWDNFNMHDPKMHYWYYKELAKALIDLKEFAVYKEYLYLIDTIFSKYL